jgi:hypothetical protein
VFNKLYTLANMPIQRFGSMLVSKGKFGAYMELLHASHRDENLASVMCRTLVSVDWQGYVYDCDFNQMLGLPLKLNGARRVRLAELIGRDLAGNRSRWRPRYGCSGLRRRAGVKPMAVSLSLRWQRRSAHESIESPGRRRAQASSPRSSPSADTATSPSTRSRASRSRSRPTIGLIPGRRSPASSPCTWR